MALSDPRTDTLFEALGLIKPRSQNRSMMDMITGPNEGTDEEPTASARPDILTALLQGVIDGQSVVTNGARLPTPQVQPQRFAQARPSGRVETDAEDTQLEETEFQQPSATNTDPGSEIEQDTLAQDISILRFEGMTDEQIAKMLQTQLGYSEQDAFDYLQSVK